MGNSLLDFVMTLVRDPDVAARYAADPAGMLADAHLPGVTAADVQSLIPVVTDSLATAMPDFGGLAGGLTGPLADTANVWTSGAAAAAFDAFTVPHHAPVVEQGAPPQVTAIQVEHSPDVPDVAPLESTPDPIIVDPFFDQVPVEPTDHDGVDQQGWQQSPDIATDHHVVDHSGFDLF